MKRLIVTFGLLTAGAMGQSIHLQKACYDQAAKVASKDGTYSNHYDARSKTCWVEEFSNIGSSPVTYYRTVYNAFEQGGLAEATFAGELGKKPAYCWVGSQQCRSINEFDMLVSQHYGLK